MDEEVLPVNAWFLGSSLDGKWDGIWDHKESDPVEVVVELPGWMSRIAQERIWHPSQRITVLDELGEHI